jgi:hypothetical protein
VAEIVVECAALHDGAARIVRDGMDLAAAGERLLAELAVAAGSARGLAVAGALATCRGSWSADLGALGAAVLDLAAATGRAATAYTTADTGAAATPAPA